ncbi:hypothetical protein MKEN_00998800 [Mycena kentingensis (nom. inval.)]|nr:hypothetical protein MKEN_00998800 [Mycena kentingensis (nom. inval.)]
MKGGEGRLDVLVNNACTTKYDTNNDNLPPLLHAASTPSSPAVTVNVATDMSSNTVMSSGKAPAFLHKYIAYNTSKAAQNAYTIALAHELSTDGIKVNAATPDFASTKLSGFAAGRKTTLPGVEMIPPLLLGGDRQTGAIGGPR